MAAGFVDVGPDLLPAAQSAREYVRSHHTEAELDLLAIQRRCQALGDDRPHREVVRPVLHLLAKVARRVGPYRHVVERIGAILERGVFDPATRMMFYEIAHTSRCELASMRVDMESARARLRDVADRERDAHHLVVQMQEALAEANARVRVLEVQARQRDAIVGRQRAMLEAAQESVDALERQLHDAGQHDVMNGALRKQVADLQQQTARQARETLEALELLQQANEQNAALQSEVAELRSRPRRRSSRSRTSSMMPWRFTARGDALPKPSPGQGDTAPGERGAAAGGGAATTGSEPEAPLTPRPNWARVAQETHLDVDLLSTQDAVQALVDELHARHQRVRMLEREDSLQLEEIENERLAKATYMDDKTTWHQGLGTGDAVPKYLRVAGPVRRRVLSKRQTEAIVREVWHMKKAYDRQHGATSRLADYFYTYLSLKHGATTALQEWGYSLTEALKAFRYDADIYLFDLILSGEVSEDVYDDQRQMVAKLMDACAQQDTKKTGTISRRDFIRVLLRQFPGKPKAHLRALDRSLEQVAKESGVVHYVKLFEEDRDGDQGPFAEALRDQQLQEIMQLHKEMKDALEREGAGEALTAAQVRRALLSVDRKLPRKEVNQILEDVFALPWKRIGKRTADAQHVIRTIKSKGVHKRHSRKANDDGVGAHEDYEADMAEADNEVRPADDDPDDDDESDAAETPAPGTTN